MVAMRHGSRGFLSALLASLALCAPSAQAQGPSLVPLSEVTLPGGLAGAREAIDDRAAPDRAVFLVEVVQRFYNTPRQTQENETPQLRALLTRLERFSRRAVQDAPSPNVPDVVPLPLTPAWWSEVAFRRKVTPDTLVLGILQSRDAACLYWALLALDPSTRVWLADQPELIDRLMRGRAATLVVAAPGIRVANGHMWLPGGERARPAWEALVGAKAADPQSFLRRVVEADQGWLAYFFSSLSQLTDAQVRVALRLDDEDPARRVDAIERIYRVFIRAGQGWNISARPFSRPPLDPSLLLSELRADAQGRLVLSGDQRFWQDVFDARGDPAKAAATAGHVIEGAPADLVWLLEQIFDVGPVECRLRSEQVLFASRVFERLSPEAAADAVVTLAALGNYPALVRALERLRVTDAAVYRRAVDRASVLNGIRDVEARARATAQFQGALALIARAAARASLTPQEVPALVTALSQVGTSDAGDYEGRVARWIDDHLRPRVPQAAPAEAVSGGSTPGGAGGVPPIERDLLQLLSGPPGSQSSDIEWEGTQYHIDLAAAEASRLERVRGEQPVRYLPAAWTLLAMADRLSHGDASAETVSREAAIFEDVAREVAVHDHDGVPGGDSPASRRDLARAFQEVVRSGVTADARRLTSPLRLLADDLTARGLTELAYAAALGGADAGPIVAADAASRHDFGFGRDDGAGGPIAWRLPMPSVRARGPWHIEGSLLALDVCLADRSLTRVSAKPPPAPPSVDKSDRRALTEVIAIMEPASLTDAARDAIASAIRAGRARLAAAATSRDLEAIADLVPLGAIRRSLLPWVFTHERRRVASFLSTAELFRLGLGASETDGTFDAWGAPARPRLGCLCLQFPHRRPPAAFMGHLSSGILMGAVPDLNLRLAELLADLRMPAALLPSVLAAATLDLVDGAPSRYPDDLRGLLEQVQGLSLDQAEQYLALLTTDGPLVPAGAATGDAAKDQP